jgi:putative transposase
VLNETELGVWVKEADRKMGISEATFYKWRQKYDGLGPSDLLRLRQIEEKNNKLKRIVVPLSLNKAMPQKVLAKNVRNPSRKREFVREMMDRYGSSLRQACSMDESCSC